MIQLSVNGVIGIGIYPHLGNSFFDEVLSILPKRARIAFVDLACTHKMLKLVKFLASRGFFIWHYIDHHFDKENDQMMRIIAQLKKVCMDESVCVLSRSKKRSCELMVRSGQWIEEGVDVVFFDNDLDGFFSFLRGCGISYSDMRSDALIFEGKKGIMSNYGSVLRQAYFSIPPYLSVDPQQWDIEIQWIFNTFIHAIQDGFSGYSWEYLSFRTNKAHEKAVQNAILLAKKSKQLSCRMVWCDMTGCQEVGQRCDLPRYAQVIENMYGPSLMCSLVCGGSGKQVRISYGRSFPKIDLRKCLPSLGVGNIPNRIFVPHEAFDDFVVCWKYLIRSRDDII